MEPDAKAKIQTLGEGGLINTAGDVLTHMDNNKATRFQDPYKEGDKVRPGQEDSLAEKAKHAKHTLGEKIHNIMSHITPGN